MHLHKETDQNTSACFTVVFTTALTEQLSGKLTEHCQKEQVNTVKQISLKQSTEKREIANNPLLRLIKHKAG